MERDYVGNRVKVILAIIALATALWVLFFYSNFTHLWAPDAMLYGRAAGNFLDGKGFVFGEVWPVSLAAGLTVDAQTQAVLHPLVLAGLFAVFGRSDVIVAVASGIFFILASPVVYSLTRRLFGATAALLSLILFLADPWMLYYSVSGLTEPLFTFMLLGAILALSRGAGGRSWAPYLAAGGLLGLAHLARPVAVAFVPPVAVYAYLEGGSWPKRLVPPAAVIVAFILPVLVSILATGAMGDMVAERIDINLLSQTQAYPGHSYIRSVAPLSFWSHLKAMPGMYALKWVSQLSAVHRGFFQAFAGPVVVALFLAFPLVWGNGGRAMRLFLLTVALITAQAIVSILTTPTTRYFHPFIPLVIPFASASLIIGTRGLLAGKNALRAAVIVVVALWACFPFAYTAPLDRYALVSTYYGDIHGAKDFTSLGEFVKQHTDQGDIVLCDAPWLVAWYGDRTSVWLPNSPRDLPHLLERTEIKWLVLTEEYQLPEPWRLAFEEIARGEEDPHWEFVLGFEDGNTKGHLFKARSAY